MPLAKRIDTIQHHLSEIMNSRHRYPFFSLATFLWVASLIFGRLARWRVILYQRGWLRQRVLPCPVISIGNLEVGGTGKTPLTILLAKTLQQKGYRPVVLSRGYKGQSSKRKAVVVGDGHSLLLSAKEAGDEPYLIASSLDHVPVVIGRDRVAAGKVAIERFQPHVVLLDDGFQHIRLHRDLDVVLLDASLPFGNGFLLPRGTLRGPVKTLAACHIIVLTRSTEREPYYYSQMQIAVAPRPILRAYHSTVIRGSILADTPLRHIIPRALGDPFKATNRTVFAFSGLARNEAFWNSLEQFGWQISGSMGFKDHHNYSHNDIIQICSAAQQAKSNCLVTTEKDFFRLPQGVRIPFDLIVAGLDIDFKEHTTHWLNYIFSWLEQRIRRC
jgi:tetraacyldisaccharide 4'-kinase